jgi:cytochrome P450
MFVSQPSLFQQVLAYANRANPYPLYAQLRETPISVQEGGGFVVSTFADIRQLLADPRLSSEEKRLNQLSNLSTAGEVVPRNPSFLVLDPPRHDTLRALTTKHFGPPDAPGRVEAMRPRIREIVNERLDVLHHAGKTEFDVVDDLAYPLPVTVICDLLGVPPEDEPRFRVWSDILVATLNPDPSLFTPEFMQQLATATIEIRQYMAELIAAHRQHPGDDLLSAMATDHAPGAPMAEEDLISTAVLLLIAGHETTVNLITNGMLTLLRNPEVLERLRQDPLLATPTVEELLRFEPPVQFTFRTSLAEIPIGETIIPSDAPVVLLLAAGNRDPRQFHNPERFDPLRADNQHLGFGGGIHYCFGAPLARVETQEALRELARRLVNPRLIADPPPYRVSPVLRGPRHLSVAFDAIRD